MGSLGGGLDDYESVILGVVGRGLGGKGEGTECTASSVCSIFARRHEVMRL